MTLYQPFLDYALAVMQERLSLQPYTIPEGFECKQETTGKGKKQETIITTSYAFKSPKLRQIRAAHVQGGNSLQVLNFVIFPQLTYDLPFFGADLVTLPGGHLIALDMQPLFHDTAYQQQYTEPILPIFQTHQQHLSWGGDFPEEAKSFFSPAFLWTRPKETEVVQTRVFEAFKDSQRLSDILQAQRSYVRYRAAKDPARGMFTRFYGEAWTEEYIHGFLFDLERQLVGV
jgi:phycoerythrobilin:ferredoxin oxidoreductase